MASEIVLSSGEITLIDKIDFEHLSQWPWYYLRKDNCAIRAIETGSTRRMNREIGLLLGFDPRLEVDHRNGDSLDNRRENLREATRSQNAANRSLQSNNTSGYKGVNFDKRSQLWRARIKVRTCEIHLGLFRTPELAAMAYNRKAIAYFKDFAKLNIVE